MSKLISEADKLLEKGKIPEAIEKLKSALTAEPLNQLIATKLANVYVDSGHLESAVKVYVGLAGRLSDAGKSQISIAIYKQAIDLNPNDIPLKVKFAQECEGVGKVGDALAQGQMALQYYLKRKKYFDAANLLPLLVRMQPKDEKLKALWIEVIQWSQAEQKLPHLLVAFCGPPGIVSQEFSVGGEPTALSESLYDSLKRLVPFFPRDPKLAYAVAWAAHRRGNQRDFYHLLRECLRRDPDFCLALLLFARVFAEQQKLNESLFVYKHLKERIGADRSVDMLTLNRLVETFVEKNGWISFTEGMGVDELDAASFLKAVKGQGKEAAAEPASEKEVAPPAPAGTNQNTSAPLSPVGSSAPKPSNASFSEPAPAEIEISIGDSSGETNGNLEVEFSSGQTKVFTVEETKVMAAPAPAPSPVPPAPELEVPLEIAQEQKAAPEPEPIVEAAQVIPPVPQPEAPIVPPEPTGSDEKTEIFSPMEVVNATSRMPQAIPSVETKEIVVSEDLRIPQEEATVLVKAPVGPEPLAGTATGLFSPVEVVDAIAASRKPLESAIQPAQKEAPAEATVITTPEPILADESEVPGGAAEAESTLMIPTSTPELDAKVFMKIPSLQEDPPAAVAVPSELVVEQEPIDLGDDLLEGPTKFIVNEPEPASTKQLLAEIKRDTEEKPAENVDSLLKQAERYIAKRNYYLARKALRHSLGLGADEAQIKNRLRDIRKLEMPDSLYHTSSSDSGSKEDPVDVLERLEEALDLKESETDSSGELGTTIEGQLERILQENDPRTILDFGIALHEMGLFRQAETIFSRLVAEFPDMAFDAYYLSAISKFARKDYAGAASILKKLSADGGKTEPEKIQIYYTLGELFEKMRRPDSSKEFFKKVAEIDANYRNIRQKLEE